mgnify:CR=1 FL=1
MRRIIRDCDTLGELLAQLENVKLSLEHASELLHDTGNFESEELDNATTAIDKASTLVQAAYDSFNK